MKGLKELITNKAHNHSMEGASVTVSISSGHILYLKMSKQEVITESSYSGPFDPWLSSLCAILLQKKIREAFLLTPQDLEKYFQHDQTFWDLWSEKEECVWNIPLELLRAALDKFEGKEHLYEEASPLICRCFGIRKDDILDGVKSKAGMGCRSCKPQVDRLLSIRQNRTVSKKRYFKQLTYADWLILADEKLELFPDKTDWEMEVAGLKGNGIIVNFSKKVTQKEEEEMASMLQDFFVGALDRDLSVFLRRV